MKYILIPYIATGLMLSEILGIGYSCTDLGNVEYFGSPFIYKKASLGSSLTYFYSVSGILVNSIIWSAALFFFWWLVVKTIGDREVHQLLKWGGKLCLVIVIGFSSLFISISYITTGRGFEPESNYWYIDREAEAEQWGRNCNDKSMLWNK